MREMFPEYYRPTQEELAEKFRECVFCFDTNVLLNLYRYTSESRASLLQALEKVKDRVWLPNRVAFEYQRRRTDILLNQIGLVGKVEGAIETAIKKIDELARLSHLFAVDALIAPYRQELDSMKARLHATKEPPPDLMGGDQIFDALTNLFDRKVGKPYTKEKENEIFKAGKERYDAKVPPGYKDKGQDPNDTDQYGDLLIWFQLIDYGNTEARPIIFVTDDTKEDWWQIVRDQTLGPRLELKTEFRTGTGGKWFYLYSTEQFLKHANEYLAAEVLPKAIQETEEIKKQDAEESRHQLTGVNIHEALEALRRGDEWALAIAKKVVSKQPSVRPSTLDSVFADVVRQARIAETIYDSSGWASMAEAARKHQATIDAAMRPVREQLRLQQSVLDSVLGPIRKDIRRQQAAVDAVTRPMREVQAQLDNVLRPDREMQAILASMPSSFRSLSAPRKDRTVSDSEGSVDSQEKSVSDSEITSDENTSLESIPRQPDETAKE